MATHSNNSCKTFTKEDLVIQSRVDKYSVLFSKGQTIMNIFEVKNLDSLWTYHALDTNCCLFIIFYKGRDIYKKCIFLLFTQTLNIFTSKGSLQE